jgi:hypothetical protein
MDIRQTIHELGLEHGTIAAWPEPIAAKQLKPKHGKSPLPWKWLFSYLIVFGSACYFFNAAKNTEKSALLFVVILVICALSLPILMLLNRKVVRNIWVYPDKFLITHQSDRTTIRSSSLKTIYAYKTPSGKNNVIELVSNAGTSYVIGLPAGLVVSDLISALKNSGYCCGMPSNYAIKVTAE